VKLEELYVAMLKSSVHVHQSAQRCVLLDGEVVLDSTWASDPNNEGVWVTRLLYGSRWKGVTTMNAELIVVASWGARAVVAVERDLGGVEELVIYLSCLFLRLPWKRPSKEGATGREGTMA
jgi:hypothetical protein